MSSFQRVFQMNFSGDFVEIYKRVSPLKSEGNSFLLAFRKKRGRKILPLFYGITASGAKAMEENFRKFRFDPTKLCFLIGNKLVEGSAKLIPLAVR